MATKKNIEPRDNIRIVNLSNYVQPEVREFPSREWVTYGRNNSYFQYLIDRSRGSATNGAVINSIIDMIYGGGLTALDSSRKPDEYAQLISIFGEKDTKRVIGDLKRMGQGAFEIIYNKKKRVYKAYHMPIETLAPEKANDDGEIEAYYYAKDWSKVRSKDQVERIPAFGFGNKTKEILYIKDYNPGLFYFSTVDYHGALQYAQLEEEISNYHINNIQNGLAPSYFINFNNGYPGDEKAKAVEKQINEKYSGSSNAGRVIISFNDNKELEGTLTAVPLSDAPEQYQFLSDESMKKILVGHRVTSPLLLGLPSATGFGSNADELQTAFILMENWVAKPFRKLIIDSIDDVLAVNEISLDLAFISVNPFKEETLKKVDEVKMSNELTDDEYNEIFENLSTDKVDDEWELVDKREFSEENESIEDWANRLIKPLELSGYVKSNPNAKSYLDKDIYKVRYSYQEKYHTGRSRSFCTNMMRRTDNGVVYRKEDIDQASFSGVNNELGHKRQNYSLFKYKGGVNCSHYWEENLYRLKKKTDGTYVEDKALSSSEEVDKIPGYNPKPAGKKRSSEVEKDRADRGHHPSYK